MALFCCHGSQRIKKTVIATCPCLSVGVLGYLPVVRNPLKHFFLMFTLPAGAVDKVNVIFTSCQPPTSDQHALPAPTHTDRLLSSHSLFPSLFPLFSMPIHLSLGHFTLAFKQILGCSKQMEEALHTLNYLPDQLLAHATVQSRHLASQRTISESMSHCQTPLLYFTCSKERYVKEALSCVSALFQLLKVIYSCFTAFIVPFQPR